MKMTTEEAFIKVLQDHGIQHAFGIIGSAFIKHLEANGADSVKDFIKQLR